MRIFCGSAVQAGTPWPFNNKYWSEENSNLHYKQMMVNSTRGMPCLTMQRMLDKHSQDTNMIQPYACGALLSLAFAYLESYEADCLKVAHHNFDKGG